jgi:hypothetical protein
VKEFQRPNVSVSAPGADTDQGWAAYIIHVSECPDCMGGIDCRVAERLHAEWKAAKAAAREGRS